LTPARRLVVAAAVLAGLFSGAPAASGDGAFHFVALGDMPYGPDAIAGPAYRRLIELVNAEQPRFTVHVGDFKDGVADCSDEVYERQHAYFRLFDGALVYTPGDNDWSDCERTGSDALERLSELRRRFFEHAVSLGRRPLGLERQSDRMREHPRQRENLRWWHEGVLFVSFHTVGPDNNLEASPPLRAEAVAREAANAAWLRSAFALARERDARALVAVTHADAVKLVPGRPPRVRRGFEASITHTLLPLAEQWGRPVLLLHGDSHRHLVDQPFRNGRGQPIGNLWRLQVYGEPNVHAVRIDVDPGAPAPFRFTTIWNPQSPDPRR
jgi:hypothetical protein